MKKYIVIQDNPEYTVSYLSEDEEVNLEEVEEFNIDSQYVYILEDENPIPMEEIEKRFKFLVDSLNIGTITQGDKVVLEFPYEGDESLIEKIKPSCGCTAKVEIDSIKKVVRATYDSSKDKGGITKGINVFFKDKIQLQIVNKLGVTIDNPKKAKASLKFNGTVEEPNNKTKK